MQQKGISMNECYKPDPSAPGNSSESQSLRSDFSFRYKKKSKKTERLFEINYRKYAIVPQKGDKEPSDDKARISKIPIYFRLILLALLLRAALILTSCPDLTLWSSALSMISNSINIIKMFF